MLDFRDPGVSETLVTVPSRLNAPIYCALTVEQFDPASPRRFEIVDLTVGVRCGSALDSPCLRADVSISFVARGKGTSARVQQRK